MGELQISTNTVSFSIKGMNIFGPGCLCGIQELVLIGYFRRNKGSWNENSNVCYFVLWTQLNECLMSRQTEDWRMSPVASISVSFPTSALLPWLFALQMKNQKEALNSQTEYDLGLVSFLLKYFLHMLQSYWAKSKHFTSTNFELSCGTTAWDIHISYQSATASLGSCTSNPASC